MREWCTISYIILTLLNARGYIIQTLLNYKPNERCTTEGMRVKWRNQDK